MVDNRNILKQLLQGTITPHQARNNHTTPGKHQAFIIVTEQPKQTITPTAIFWHEVKTYEA